MIPREVFEETLLHFFEPIRPYLEDPTVSDIIDEEHPILVFLMAPLIWAVWVIFTDPPVVPTPPKPTTSAATSPSGAPRGAGSSAAPGTTEAPATVMEAPAASTSARASPPAAASASPATTGPKTPQREAADAVAAGAFDRAARLYDELAKAHPEVPAYAEAARIMKVRMGKR